MTAGHIRGVEVQLPSFILDESERSVACLSPLIQCKVPPVPIDYVAGWKLRVILDVMEEMENLSLAPASAP
jgi:hypothetical protein